MAKQLSGPDWIHQYPTSTKIDDLNVPFQNSVARFIGALELAGATIRIAATRRPQERAYLMHYAFQIARGWNPAEVPAMSGVAIEWVHATPKESLEAARQMTAAYEIVYASTLMSRHVQGHAVDMTITWNAPLPIIDAFGKTVDLDFPRNGGNHLLWPVGATYGVVKNVRDAPHWSIDGR